MSETEKSHIAKSQIWDYFDKQTSHALCLICNKDFSLGSSLPKKQTTSNIKGHLKRAHPKEWKEYSDALKLWQEAQPPKKPKPEKTGEEEDGERIKQYRDDDPICVRINKSIMDLILVDMNPYEIVEGKAFRRIHFADPLEPSRYKLKSDKYFKLSLMPSTYETFKAKIKEILLSADWVSISCDIWHHPSQDGKLFAFSVYSFTEGTERVRAMLELDISLNMNISNKIVELLSAYKIDEKVHLGVSDNEDTISTARRIGQFKCFGCTAKKLQDAVNDSILENDKIEPILLKCRELVKAFKKNESATKRFQDYQKKLELPKNPLLLDTSSKWHTTFLMFERLLEQQAALNRYAKEQQGPIKIPSEDEWNVINDLVLLLRPFYEAYTDLTKDASSVSLIIPLVAMLYKKLDLSTEDSKNLSLLKQLIQVALKESFAYIKGMPELYVATALDPKFKLLYLSPEEIQVCKKELLSCIKNMGLTTSMSNHTGMMGTHSLDESINSLWSSHDALPKIPNADGGGRATVNEVFELQWNSYLNEPLLARDTNIFAYWNMSSYDLLKPIATRYLSSPPISIVQDRLFNEIGELYAERKANWPNQLAKRSLFLSYNIRAFDFDY